MSGKPAAATSQSVSDVLWQRHTIDMFAMLLSLAEPSPLAPVVDYMEGARSTLKQLVARFVVLGSDLVR